MPKLIASAPILLVKDVIAAAAYWRDAVGFVHDRLWGDPPDFCIAKRDGLQIMLAQVDPSHQITPYWKIRDKMWNAYFWVDDADALHTELQSRGAIIDYTPCTQPYGIREFGIQDLEGHDIGFGQSIA